MTVGFFGDLFQKIDQGTLIQGDTGFQPVDSAQIQTYCRESIQTALGQKNSLQFIAKTHGREATIV
jgi:hypothetical protein